MMFEHSVHNTGNIKRWKIAGNLNNKKKSRDICKWTGIIYINRSYLPFENNLSNLIKFYSIFTPFLIKIKVEIFDGMVEILMVKFYNVS